MALLELDGVAVHYGRIQALEGVSVTVEAGEIVALIGANGAGKTTTMRAISGIRPLSAGRIVFDGEDITRLRADLRVRRGICQAPEGRGVFPGLTVLENLDMGAYTRKDRRAPAYREDLDRVFELFPRLAVLLLDEPSMGLAPQIIQQIFRIISDINEAGTTVLLVEQNASQALALAHRAYVLETGRVVQHGTGRQLLEDPAVRNAYLGVA
jgi:branched-chain amino acid transport system ATP-binding protein